MTGAGLWKDWNTQEYLEELVRLTYPKAKVNNIVPFTQYNDPLGDTFGIEYQPNTLYFCQINCHLDTPGAVLTQIGLGSSLVKVQGFVDFILFNALIHVGAGGGNSIVTGYKITLDNDILNIQGVEQPPVIEILSGRIFNPTYFYSADNNNSSGVPMLAASVETENPVDACEFFIGGQTAGIMAAAGNRSTLVADMTGFSAVVPFQVKARGTLQANHGLTSNTLLQNIVAEYKPYNYSGKMIEDTGTRFQFTNCLQGAILHVQLIDNSDSLIAEYTMHFPRAGFSSYNIFYEGFTAPGWRLVITPTQNGFECPFDYYHLII